MLLYVVFFFCTFVAADTLLLLHFLGEYFLNWGNLSEGYFCKLVNYSEKLVLCLWLSANMKGLYLWLFLRPNDE